MTFKVKRLERKRNASTEMLKHSQGPQRSTASVQ